MLLKWSLGAGLGGAVCALAIAVVNAGAPAPIRASGHHHAPMIIHERHGQKVNSTNWSGYAVEGANGSVTGVKGSWTVPSVICPATGNTYSSFWVGIDGFNSNTVEQIGTDSDCENGTAVYYVWYEFYPHPSYTVNSFAIQPGDVISAEVLYTGSKGGQFTVTLTNLSSPHTKPFSISTKVGSAKLSSAEWIVEAPWSGGVLPLANFGTAYFGADYSHQLAPGTCYYTNAKGVSSPIGPFTNGNVVEMTMVTGSGTVKAQPSDLTSDGTSFSDLWENPGP
jgi:hypothetical protein